MGVESIYTAALQEHARVYSLSPSQQFNLLQLFVGLRDLLPGLSFDFYLQQTRLVAGATKENRKFPKDALDFYCPTKDSQWPPKPRMAVLARYLEVQDALRASGEPPVSLDEFLQLPGVIDDLRPGAQSEQADESEEAQADQPAAEVPFVAPVVQAKPPKAKKTKVKPEPAAAPTEPVESPVQPGIAVYTDLEDVQHTGMVLAIYHRKNLPVAEFISETGKIFEDAEVDRLVAVPDAAVPVTARIEVTPEGFAEAQRLMASPTAIPGIATGTYLKSWGAEIPTPGPDKYRVLISVYNADPRPGVDAVLICNDKFVASSRIRGELLGYYAFPVEGVVRIVQVVMGAT